VYCPELHFETEDHVHETMQVTLIGRAALPRYTSLHPSEPLSVTPARSPEEELAPVPHTALEQRSSVQDEREIIAPLPATSQLGDRRQLQHASIPTIEKQTPQEELNILLGHEPQAEQAVYFPSQPTREPPCTHCWDTWHGQDDHGAKRLSSLL
jgi:hypothetical protein